MPTAPRAMRSNARAATVKPMTLITINTMSHPSGRSRIDRRADKFDEELDERPDADEKPTYKKTRPEPGSLRFDHATRSVTFGPLAAQARRSAPAASFLKMNPFQDQLEEG